MRVVIADASSLILLAKGSLLETYALRTLLLMPREVAKEAAARELWQARPDTQEIARCIDEELIRVERAASRRSLPISLGAGEAAAIRLFLSKDADLLLSDDRRALTACRLLAIPFTTAPRVVVDLCAARAIDRGRARRALEKIAVAGRYSRDVIAAALVALTEIRDDQPDDDPSA